MNRNYIQGNEENLSEASGSKPMEKAKTIAGSKKGHDKIELSFAHSIPKSPYIEDNFHQTP